MASESWNRARAKQVAMCFGCEREVGVKTVRYGTHGLKADTVAKICPHYTPGVKKRCPGSGIAVPLVAVMDRS